MKNIFASQNRYNAPLHEKTDRELLIALRHARTDAERCRAQLLKKGWTPEHIEEYSQ